VSETNSNTNISIKQRLVGALVLVSLAVIFIPMVLDGEGPFEVSNSKTFIPDEPMFKFETAGQAIKSEPVVESPAAKEQVASNTANDRGIIVDQISEQAFSINSAAIDKNTLGDTSDDVMPAPLKPLVPPKTTKPQDVKAKEVIKIVKKHKTVIQSKPKAKIAALKNSQQRTVKAWAVQLASFKTKPNALKLRDKLRVKGFASYVEKRRNSKGILYRVRVGPELKRTSAEKLKKKLAKAAKLNGFVVSH